LASAGRRAAADADQEIQKPQMRKARRGQGEKELKFRSSFGIAQFSSPSSVLVEVRSDSNTQKTTVISRTVQHGIHVQVLKFQILFFRCAVDRSAVPSLRALFTTVAR
jgi:hypothetical protein